MLLKIEIKDKKLFIKNTLLAVGMLSLMSTCLWQVNTGLSLRNALAEKKAELKEAQKTSKHLKKIERLALDLEEKEKVILQKAPLGEQHPFSLIKALTVLADEIKLKNTAFRVKENLPGATASAQSQAAVLPNDAMTEDIASQPSVDGIQFQSQPSPVGLQSLPFEMRFDSTYLQLLKLLQKIHTLQRVITVEQIKVERKKELAPFQKITLLLTAYSFPKE